jgi:type IV secretory pathway TrbD component
MIGVLIFGILLVIAMLGLLIWVLNKAYARKDE